uniref:Uncharacterized protein n=1 Tax=Anopheles coluzzii TaxID=1518534 RepID=A0A8W7PNU3_ANOCL
MDKEDIADIVSDVASSTLSKLSSSEMSELHRLASELSGKSVMWLWSLLGDSSLIDLSSLSEWFFSPSVAPLAFALDLREIFFILARWFWNHTCTTRTDRPVSFASASLTLRHGLGDTSNDALNWRRWAESVVEQVVIAVPVEVGGRWQMWPQSRSSTTVVVMHGGRCRCSRSCRCCGRGTVEIFLQIMLTD